MSSSTNSKIVKPEKPARDTIAPSDLTFGLSTCKRCLWIKYWFKVTMPGQFPLVKPLSSAQEEHFRRLRGRGEVPLGEVDIAGHALVRGAIRGGAPDRRVDQPGPGTVQVRDPRRALRRRGVHDDRFHHTPDFGGVGRVGQPQRGEVLPVHDGVQPHE